MQPARLKHSNLSTISSEAIIVANDLTPSNAAQLNKKYTLGFVTKSVVEPVIPRLWRDL